MAGMRARIVVSLALASALVAACTPFSGTPTPESTSMAAGGSTKNTPVSSGGAARGSAGPAGTAAASPSVAPSVSPRAAAADFKDAAYEVGGRWLRLTNGVSEIEPAPGSASKVVTRYFGNEARGDLDGDGVEDVGFLVSQTAGGSGTFYYAVVATRTADGWVGTNGVLLGDRVAPQTTQFENGVLIVNYAERRPGEPMSAQPSQGISKRLRVVGGRLVE